MKIFKLSQYEEDEDWYEDQGVEGLDSKQINTVAYHGTTVDSVEEIFEELDLNYSDWGAYWVATDEYAAEAFAERYGDGKIELVFRGSLNLEKMATITSSDFDSLKDFYGIYDLREAIPFLTQAGFDGWETSGSIDSLMYDDIACFNDGFEIELVKYKKDGEWSTYMTISEASLELKEIS